MQVNKNLPVLAAVGASLATMGSNALAAAQDYSGVQTALTQELTAAIPIGLAVGGLVMGVFLAWRVVKRFSKG